MLRVAPVATRRVLGAETVPKGCSWFHTLGSSVEVNVTDDNVVVELVGAIFCQTADGRVLEGWF